MVTYASDAKAYTNAGTWTTNVAIPFGNSNYVFAEGTTTSAALTVNKAESKILASATTSTYYKNNGGRATLKADGIKADFVKLQIKNSSGEWEDVAASNYEVKEGSTIVELRQTYLTSKTSDGKDRFEYDKDYTFRFVYDDNYSNSPESTLKIRKYTAPSNNSSSSSTTTTTTKKVVNTATH